MFLLRYTSHHAVLRSESVESVGTVCFRPPGSVVIFFGSGSFHQQAKKGRKNLKFLLFCDFFVTFFIKTDANVIQKAISKKKLVGILSANDEKAGSGSVSVVRICGSRSGSVQKCHGSTTLSHALLLSSALQLSGFSL
jgi:hypothetical protein